MHQYSTMVKKTIKIPADTYVPFHRIMQLTDRAMKRNLSTNLPLSSIVDPGYVVQEFTCGICKSTIKIATDITMLQGKGGSRILDNCACNHRLGETATRYNQFLSGVQHSARYLFLKDKSSIMDDVEVIESANLDLPVVRRYHKIMIDKDTQTQRNPFESIEIIPESSISDSESELEIQLPGLRQNSTSPPNNTSPEPVKRLWGQRRKEAARKRQRDPKTGKFLKK